MNSFFVYIDTLDKFLSKKISVNETNTKYITGLLDGEEISCSPSEVDITWTQLVFIKSLQKIWTHGKFYNNSEKETEEEKKAITDYYTNQYLTTEALEAGTISFNIWKNMGTDMITSISYSTDNGETWTTTNNVNNKGQHLTISVNVSEGDKVLWKGDAQQLGYYDYDKDYDNYVGSFFSSDCEFNVQGNVMSMLYGDDFVGEETLEYEGELARLFSGYGGEHACLVVSAEHMVLPATTLANWCYSYMFKGCTSLTAAPELPATTLTDACYISMFEGCISLVTAPELPATKLAMSCYSSMFSGCTSLTTAPELPATTLAPSCYNNMFSGCTSLTSAPELPATTLVSDCYGGMFYGCTSLVTAPELPTTTLANFCYSGMFYGCTNLTKAPELPATTLATFCYSSMFKGCTSLETAPELPATTLAYGCYQSMFQGCSKLSSITCLATDISASNCTNGWVHGVAASGTFVKPDTMSDWTTGANGIPSGWATRTETDVELVHKYELNAVIAAQVAALDEVTLSDIEALT